MSNLKYIVQVPDDSPEALRQRLLEAAQIITRLRDTQKTWEKQYGYLNKEAKKLWEGKADEWVENNVTIQKRD